MSFDGFFEEPDQLHQELYSAVLKDCINAGYRPMRTSLYTWVDATIMEISKERGVKLESLQQMYGSYFDEIKEKSVAAIIKDINKEGR